MYVTIYSSFNFSAFSESEETWSGNRRNQTIDGGTHTITLSNLTIDSPGVEKSAIDITGNADVTFILEGATTLSEVTGIILPSGWSPVPPLPLKETDYSRPLRRGASIGLGAAGIGGGYGASSNFGNITINGGTIIARGSGGGAGIGGGYEVSSRTVTGNVTINGGYVTAIGGSSGSTGGAGIGSGENANYSGTVTIQRRCGIRRGQCGLHQHRRRQPCYRYKRQRAFTHRHGRKRRHRGPGRH